MSEPQTAPLSENTASKLDHLASEAASVEGDSTGGFMKPGQEIKRKRGRPRKDDAGPKTTVGSGGPASSGGTAMGGVAQDNTAVYKQILSPVWQTLSAVAQQITGEVDAGMKPMEHQLITDSSAACVNQYIPDALGKHANLVIFLVSMGTWSGRVYLIYLAKKELIEEQKMTRAKNASPHTNGQAGPQVMAQ